MNQQKVDSRHSSSINERIGGEEQYLEETEGEIEDVDQLLINLIDLISFGDHKELQNLLNKVEIDLAEVFDERGYNLIHICAQNNDYICLNIIINYAFLYWNNNQDIN